MKIFTEDEFKNSFKEKYDYVLNHKNILESSCIIFVYNSISNYSANDLHISECVYEDEIALIKDSFHAFPNLKLLTYESEELFLNAANLIKQTYQHVLVYSMAQDVAGTGRRCLIPLICEYYGFINISSNSRSSFLGGDKNLMFTLLHKQIKTPEKIFLDSLDNQQIHNFRQSINSDLILKPNSESASIGVEKLAKSNDDEQIYSIVKKSIYLYGKIFLEEFITGEEVECTVLRWGNGLYVLEPVRIIKNSEFLDYNTVASDSYGFEIYRSRCAAQIKEQALKAYDILGFDSIARFDFMVKNESAYLFDITPNPTISSCSSANTAMNLIENDDRAIYIALLLDKLFIPTLN